MKRKENKLLLLIPLVLILSGVIVTTGLFQATSFDVSNNILAEMRIYDDSGPDGYGERTEITYAEQRIFTTLYVEVVVSDTTNLAGFKLQLLNEASDQIIHSVDMTRVTGTGNIFTATINVDGYAIGYYNLRAKGISTKSTVTYEEDNPDYLAAQQEIRAGTTETELEDMVKAGAYGGVWPIPEIVTVSETKNDIDIYNPPTTLIYIKNPAKPMTFSFSYSQTNLYGPVTFKLSITEGATLGTSLVIRRDSDNKRVASTTDISSFVFNENMGESDGSYTATIYLSGSTGWVGGSKSVTFTIDNPNPLEGQNHVYVLEDGNWIEVYSGSNIQGEIKVSSIFNTDMDVDRVVATWINSQTQKEVMSFNLVKTQDTVWTANFDTRKLVNGRYELKIRAERDLDGATLSLSAFSTETENMLLTGDLIIGIILIATGVFVFVFLQRRRMI